MRWTTVLIEHPWLALVIAAVLAVLWWRTRSRITLVTAALWAAYAGWEIAVSEDHPDANIRIDLLAIYPALAILTVIATWFGIRQRTSRD